NMRTIAKRRLYNMDVELLFFGVGGIIGTAALISIMSGASTAWLVSLILAGACILTGASLLYNRIKSRLTVRKNLFKIFMEFQSSLKGSLFDKLKADPFGSVPFLDRDRIFLIDPLHPGQEIYTERNKYGEIINVYDREGSQIAFIDYAKANYLDDEELDLKEPLWIKFSFLASLIAFIFSLITLLLDAPPLILYGFIASSILLLATGTLYLRSYLHSNNREIILTHTLAQIKRQAGEQKKQPLGGKPENPSSSDILPPG
ncbi:MAG: hypothetical protein KDK34_19035, partial [Leptospiraceae bacterium]|nr:hypothetical protein [Leptospiraceae bacterium]